MVRPASVDKHANEETNWMGALSRQPNLLWIFMEDIPLRSFILHSGVAPCFKIQTSSLSRAFYFVMYFISQLHGKGAEHSIQKISMMPRLWLLLLLFGAAFWYEKKVIFSKKWFFPPYYTEKKLCTLLFYVWSDKVYMSTKVHSSGQGRMIR